MAGFEPRCSLKLWVAVLVLALYSTPGWAAWGDIGDCSFALVDGLRYHETWGQIGDDGGLWLAATEVGWSRRFVWGKNAGGGFWITPRPARRGTLERFWSQATWERRLTQLGVKTPVKTRTIEALRPWTCELTEITDPLFFVGLLAFWWVVFGNPLPALLSLAFGTLLIARRRRRGSRATSSQPVRTKAG